MVVVPPPLPSAPSQLAASVYLLCVSNRPKIPTLSSSPTTSSTTRSDTASSAPFGSMPFKRFVLIGWVALVNYSKDYGRLIVIVDVVDQNRLHCSVIHLCHCFLVYPQERRGHGPPRGRDHATPLGPPRRRHAEGRLRWLQIEAAERDKAIGSQGLHIPPLLDFLSKI
ncbi:hypothetical protein ACQJBY_038735 [Aegilops geniculata]